MIIDTHCHVYEREMENAEEIIQEAFENDIHLILNGTDVKSNLEVLDLSERFENVHAALGYHPFHADEISEEDICLLDSQLSNGNVVAVGEIGLDYYHGKENKDMQIEVFERMLDLAQMHNLPVIVHCRKAMQDTYDILKGHDVVGCLHSYPGSAEMAQQFIKMGFHIGVGGTITHKNNKKTRKVLEKIGIDHIIVETDSPYLAPEEKRREINTPMNLKYVISKIAEELDMKECDVEKITSKNAEILFKI